MEVPGGGESARRVGWLVRQPLAEVVRVREPAGQDHVPLNEAGTGLLPDRAATNPALTPAPVPSEPLQLSLERRARLKHLNAEGVA